MFTVLCTCFSLVKMVYSFVEKSKEKPTWFEMLHSIKRNFGGLDQVDPAACFKKHLAPVLNCNAGVSKQSKYIVYAYSICNKILCVRVMVEKMVVLTGWMSSVFG